MDKLRAEWPGILAWMIRGCLDWQIYGLEQADAVLIATDHDLLAEDMFVAWLDDACEIGADAWATGADLFASWSTWAERANEPKPQRRKFGEALLAHGFGSRRGSRGERGFQGLKLKPWSAAG